MKILNLNSIKLIPRSVIFALVFNKVIVLNIERICLYFRLDRSLFSIFVY